MIDRATIRDTLIAGLAEVEDCGVEEIEAAIVAAGGDDGFHLDSKQTEWVVAHVEFALSLDRLPKPADLNRDQFATLTALLEAISDASDITPKQE